ncbi:MAG: hypothetical protein ACE5GT_13470 [Rhodospirillales bacterium]
MLTNSAAALDKPRAHVLKTLAANLGLDSAAFENHLIPCGLSPVFDASSGAGGDDHAFLIDRRSPGKGR